jgi:CysZ protein
MRELHMRGSVTDGARYLLRGASMLKHPRLRPFVIVPLLINIVIFASLLYLSISALSETLENWIGAIPQWLSFLRVLVWPLVSLALALVSGYAFTAVAIIIASPFNGLLAEKAEELITGEPVTGPEGLMGALGLFPRAIARELGKFAYYIPLLLVVLVLSFILAALAPFLWFALGAWMMSVQYVDYPMDNHQLDFAEVKDVLRERRLSSLGFGGMVALMSGIPILNFFVVPAAVCGATVFWCEELRYKD